MPRSLVLAIALPACAFATIKGPEDTSGRTRPACTTSIDASRIDIGAGTAAGLVGIVSGVFIADDNKTAGTSILVAGVAALAAFYTSAAIGYVRTRRCKDAIGEYNFRAPDPIEPDAP